MARRGVLLVVALAVLSACQVRTDVSVAVNDDGSGTVAVAVGVDDDAIKKAPEITRVRTEDLTAAGWSVAGPRKEADGFTWFRASKPFADPDETNRILSEISGPDGPFKNFAVTRDRSFAATDFGVTGTVDLTGGLATFGDSGLAAQLDGQPIGNDIATIERQVGAPLDDVFRFRLIVQLPGSMESNGSQLGNAALWQPRLSDTAPTEVTATSSARRWPTLIGVAVIAIALIGLIVWLITRTWGRKPGHSREGDPKFGAPRTVIPPA